jgi:hypothetical protein
MNNLNDTELSKLQKLLVDIQQADKDYIAKLKVSEPLEADLRPFLAALKNEIDDGKMSESRIEREALGSAGYRRHVAEVVAARLETIEAERKFDNLCKWLDALRSELATERESIKRGLFLEGSPR